MDVGRWEETREVACDGLSFERGPKGSPVLARSDDVSRLPIREIHPRIHSLAKKNVRNGSSNFKISIRVTCELLGPTSGRAWKGGRTALLGPSPNCGPSVDALDGSRHWPRHQHVLAAPTAHTSSSGTPSAGMRRGGHIHNDDWSFVEG